MPSRCMRLVTAALSELLPCTLVAVLQSPAVGISSVIGFLSSNLPNCLLLKRLAQQQLSECPSSSESPTLAGSARQVPVEPVSLLSLAILPDP
mmetsp:Transcript_31021/g.94933  ORF Transcript_31021/g.94933 Transcript_31021/m.94933 type:complete len:93 (+) Transcript_31021:2523-2801(+)|eukprot:scaffold278233_cov37-Tisochrysis_lutea.AAC.3